MEKIFYIYKITCLKNNNYYIGRHSTYNISDGYFGSGKMLKYSVNEYGKEFHTIEILEYLPDLTSLMAREMEIVNEEMLSDFLCINMKIGGGGGGFYSKEHALKAQSSGGRKSISINKEVHFLKLKNDSDYKQRWIKSRSNSAMGEKNPFYGKKHKQSTIDKMRKSKNVGVKNSQFGKCWIKRNGECLSIKIDDIDIYLSDGWVKGRNKKT